MKKALALRHVHFEDLGILEPLLQDSDYQVHYLDATVADLHACAVGDIDLLIILGGPVSVYDEQIYPFLADELELVKHQLDAGKPLLGICLGAQLIAKAMGADVYPLGVKEIGFAPLTLTEEGRSSVLAPLADTQVLHWHGDRFDIPKGAIRLAETPICSSQAFAVGNTVLALQFHLEIDRSGFERWLVGHAAELSHSGIDPRALRMDAAHYCEATAAAGSAAIARWLKAL